MLNLKDMKSGDILLCEEKYSKSSVLLLSDLTMLGTGLAFIADVFWLDKNWCKQRNAILYQSEQWSKLC